MATSLIPLSAFYGITVNGLTANPLSGFTLATPFTCSLSAQAGITQAAITSNYNIIWWFGDGTYSTEYSPTHTYNWPGVYEVKVGLYNNNPGDLSIGSSPVTSLDINVDNANWTLTTRAGVVPFTFSTTITASNFIIDKLYWSSTNWASAGVPTFSSLTGPRTFYGYQSSYSGTSAIGPIPLTVNYFTSLIDNSNINFSFYADNSLSQPWTQVLDGQLANLRPRWRFTSASATSLSNEAVLTNYQPISSTPILIDEYGRYSSTGTLIGLSGSFNFYYVDDLPSLIATSLTGAKVNPTTIWVNLEALNIPVPPSLDYDYAETPSYANTVVSLSAYYYVRSFTPYNYDFTLNGAVDLNSTYWSNASSRYVLNVSGPNFLSGTASFLSDINLLNYPNSLLSGSNYFSVSSVNGLIANNALFTNGYYIGSFAPYVSSGSVITCLTAVSLSGLYYMPDLKPDSVYGYNPLVLSSAVSSISAICIPNFNGASDPFQIVDFNSTYFARKFGAGFDYGPVLKTYALQPSIADNPNFFTYINAVAGTSATNDDTFGGVLYEKITNFVENTSDPFVSNVNQFYSLSELLDLNLDNFNYQNIPPSLGKIYDLYSVQQSRIWGARTQDARNFALSAGFPNLGGVLSAYDITSTTVNAGQKIVVNDLFNPQYYELLEVPNISSYAAISARGLQNYFQPYYIPNSTPSYPEFYNNGPVGNFINSGWAVSGSNPPSINDVQAGWICNGPGVLNSTVTGVTAYGPPGNRVQIYVSVANGSFNNGSYYSFYNPLSALIVNPYYTNLPITTYPLSAFFGCGLKTPVQNYYRFFVYVGSSTEQQVEGLINWDDPLTTLSEQASSHTVWVNDGGTLENIFSYYIHKGLGLID